MRVATISVILATSVVFYKSTRFNIRRQNSRERVGKMSTMNNLQEAFSGESQANRRYLAFAKKADQDGFPQVAKLFRAAAEAETVHANAHLRVMGGIKSTAENL